jgi:4-amino-4-deoxy-L-arabinose transferase-like glycosyltransferase
MSIVAVFERPERGLAALMAAQLAFWTLAPALSHSAPPLDVVEMYVWGREHVIATFKHPNLPGLVLEGVRLLTGQVGWPAYLVSQLCIAMTFWAVFALGRELMDAPRALAGVLLLTGVYFFSWTTPEFNHNVAQMPLWALATLFLWRATTRGKALDWVLLGAFAGLSLWAKYSSAVLLVVSAAWILWDEAARKRILTAGPWFALFSFAAVAAPQAIWLVEHDFSPLAYAARRASGSHWYAPIEFLLTLALDHLPMLLLLACAGFLGKAVDDTTPERRALRFLLLLGLGPALLTAIGATLTGSGVRSSWGAPMVVLSGLIVVALLSPRFSAARLRRLGVGAGLLIVLVSGLYYAHMRYGLVLTGKPLRGNWPQAEISDALQQTWRSETNNAPLRVVIGDIWTAGLIGLHDRHPPSVLINGDFGASPWVSPEEVREYGALVVWSGHEPAALAPLTETLATRDRVFTPRLARASASPVRVSYAVIPPRRAAAP